MTIPGEIEGLWHTDMEAVILCVVRWFVIRLPTEEESREIVEDVAGGR